jgi:outer membrane lipoprotein SlyB
MSGMTRDLGPIGTVIGLAAGTYLSAGTGTAAMLAAGAQGAAAGAALGTAGGMLLNKVPKPPAIPAQLSQPDPNQIMRQQQQQIALQMSRGGRASTILTPPSGEKLG